MIGKKGLFPGTRLGHDEIWSIFNLILKKAYKRIKNFIWILNPLVEYKDKYILNRWNNVSNIVDYKSEMDEI